MKAKENKISSADIKYKIVLLGDTNSGKTIFFKKLTSGLFNEKNISTIGMDKRTIRVKCDLEEKDGKISTKIVEITLFDTAGQERYRSITKSYFMGSDAVIILYDITDKRTFNDVESWIEAIINCSNNDINNYVIFLMGSKLHLIESGDKEREVEVDEAIKICKEKQLEWGGEYRDIDSTEQFLNKFKEFIKIIYKKIGVKKVQDEKIKLGASKYIKKKKDTC